MPIARRLRAFLDDNQVKYQSLIHREAFTAQEIAAAQHVPGKYLAKIVVVRCDDYYLMVVLPAPWKIDLKKLGEILNKPEVKLASEERFKELFPDCEIGAMPPFGNLYNIQVLVDESLKEDEYIVFNAGTHTDCLKIAYSDFERLVKPKVAKFAVK